MSAEGPVPPAARRARGPARPRLSAVLAAVIAAPPAVACGGAPGALLLASEASPDGRRHAEVRAVRCGAEWCQELLAGTAGEEPVRLATLRHEDERSGEIAWARDGRRVGFVVNGYQLRLYDVETGAPAGSVDLVPADGPPTSRVARGVTFSETGAAITFDDCPRGRSGCRPGLVALR